jgi:hypothetical protein
MRNAVIAAVVLLSATTAAAQPAMTWPTQPYYQQPQPIPEVKSESNATLLAIGTTLGGLALAAAGVEHEEGAVVLGGMAMMLIGPSAGHFYAGENAHGVKMTLLRTGAALVLGAGLIETTLTADCAVAADENGNGGSCGPTREDRENGRKMVWIGGGVLIAATLYDLWDAHDAAHRANVREARRNWSVAPSIMAGASGTNMPGLTLGGQF